MAHGRIGFISDEPLVTTMRPTSDEKLPVEKGGPKQPAVHCVYIQRLQWRIMDLRWPVSQSKLFRKQGYLFDQVC